MTANRPKTPRPRRRWRRTLLVGLLTLLILLGLAWLIVPKLAGPMIERKLQTMISSRLDADLQIGSLRYLPPFGVRVNDAKLVTATTEHGHVDLLKIDRLDLRLAKLPFGEGPLVIKKIDIRGPSLHLVQTPEGIIGAHRLFKSQPDLTSHPSGEWSGGGGKLSDMFELRSFTVQGGRVVYEDRTRPDRVPLEWKDFQVDVKTEPVAGAKGGKSVYTYSFDTRHGGVAKLTSAGRFDIDELLVEADNLSLAVKVDPDDATSPVPGPLQSVLRDYRVRGRLDVTAKATLPLRDLESSTYQATLEIRDASAYLPEWDESLEGLAVRLRSETKPPNKTNPPNPPARGTAPATQPSPRPVITVALEQFDAKIGRGGVQVDKTQLTLDRAAGTWKLAEVAGRLDLGPPDRRPTTFTASAKTKPTSRPGVDAPKFQSILAQRDAAGTLSFTVSANGPLRPPPGETMWRASRVRALAYPDRLRVRPPGWPRSLENVGGGGVIELRGNVVVFQDLSATYGGDRILLAGARLPIPDDPGDFKDKGFRVEEIEATFQFRQPQPEYPKGLDRVFRRLRPSGPFLVGGGSWYAVNVVEADAGSRGRESSGRRKGRRRKADYFFSISSDEGAFALTERKIPLTKIRGDATVSGMLVEIPRLEGRMLGGTVVTALTISPNKLAPFQGRASARDIDLAEVAEAFDLSEKAKEKVSGRGYLNIEFAGTGGRRRPAPGAKGGANEATEVDEVDPADTFEGRGEFEVLGGRFWSLPVLRDVTKALGQEDAATVGEAAGVFNVYDQTIELKNAAVSSPALGLQGTGKIGFDRSLDLQIVAAPLGDWRDKLKQTKVPLLGDVAAEVVGGIQQILNTATGTLLYEFRVTGEADDPEIQTVPAPVLSDPAALLFGRMLKNQKDQRLIESLRKERDQRDQRDQRDD